MGSVTCCHSTHPHMPLCLISKPVKKATSLAWRQEPFLWNRVCTAEHPLRSPHRHNLQTLLWDRYACRKLDWSSSKTRLVLAAWKLIHSVLQAGFTSNAKLSTAVVNYRYFSWLLWNQFMQALHQQLSDSPATPAATSHPTALTGTSQWEGTLPRSSWEHSEGMCQWNDSSAQHG